MIHEHLEWEWLLYMLTEELCCVSWSWTVDQTVLYVNWVRLQISKSLAECWIYGSWSFECLVPHTTELLQIRYLWRRDAQQCLSAILQRGDNLWDFLFASLDLWNFLFTSLSLWGLALEHGHCLRGGNFLLQELIPIENWGKIESGRLVPPVSASSHHVFSVPLTCFSCLIFYL